VFKLIHNSLEQTGKSKVRVRARRDSEIDVVHFVINDAECHHEPIYPRTCIIDRHSNSLIRD
jgi:hypothetical protein